MRRPLMLAMIVAAVSGAAHPGPRNMPDPSGSKCVSVATTFEHVRPALSLVPYVGYAFVPLQVTGDGTWSAETQVDTDTTNYNDRRHKVVHVTTFPGIGTSQPEGAFVFSWNASHGERPFIWRPLSSTNYLTETPNITLFNAKCAAHIGLDDATGRVLFYGGTGGEGNPLHPEGEKYGRIFDPQGSGSTYYVSAPDMEFPRYYPGATRMSDGRILITTGEHSIQGPIQQGEPAWTRYYQDTPELYTPPQQGSSGGGWIKTLPSSAQLAMMTDYPYLVVSPRTGDMLFLGPQGYIDGVQSHGNRGVSPMRLDRLSLTWSAFGQDPNNLARTTGLYAGAFALVDGVFYKGGGYADNQWAAGPTAGVSKIDLRASDNPTWTSAGTFAGSDSERAFHYLVALADGSLLSIGGSRDGTGSPTFVTAPQIYNPRDTSPAWRALNPYTFTTTLAHGYHSVAYLLPDARVMLAGGQYRAPNVTQSSPDVYRIFTPPYLDDGKAATRPTNLTAPSNFVYGANVTITATVASGRTLERCTLVALPSPTHATDNNQRLWTMTKNIDGTFVVPNRFQCPPGWYMLFAIDSAGVPSVAKYVRVWDKFERVYPVEVAKLLTGGPSTQSSASTTASDNDIIDVPVSGVFLPSTSAMTATSNAPSSSGITAIRVKAEGRQATAVTAPVYFKAYLKDFTTGNWVRIGPVPAVQTTTSDAEYESVITTTEEPDLSKFVSSITGQIVAKVVMESDDDFGSAKWDVVEVGMSY